MSRANHKSAHEDWKLTKTELRCYVTLWWRNNSFSAVVSGTLALFKDISILRKRSLWTHWVGGCGEMLLSNKVMQKPSGFRSKVWICWIGTFWIWCTPKLKVVIWWILTVY